MRLLYKHQHEGVWFSKNGHKAYLRGEKPLFLWADQQGLESTVEHHIARSKAKYGTDYTRELVMFYRRKN